MIHLTFRTNALLISMPLLALLASSNTYAEIYKWRDNRGVTQYSDRPPVSSFSKLTSNELVNSLQTKDLCTVGPIKKSVASNAAASAKENSGFFNIFSRATLGATPAKSVAAASNSTSRSVANVMPFAKTSIAPLQVASATTTFKPVTTAASNSFSRGGVSVMSFGKTSFSPIQTANATPVLKPVAGVVDSPSLLPVKPTANVPSASNPTQPAKTTPSVTASATQVATAPPATTNILTPVSDVANIIQKALMPAVNISKNILPAIGYDSIKIKPTTHPANPQGGGDFRTGCGVSHMSNDDPLVYPNQQGAAHHHTFFGNTSLNYKSNLNTLSSTGNSTCIGGTANRSAYWIPSMIDTSTNTPIVPDEASFYYKHGLIDGALIKSPPKGLRILAGNSKATNSKEAQTLFQCLPGAKSTRKDWPNYRDIPTGKSCEAGDKMNFMISFPQCWDGKNLDSPNHKDHMAYPINLYNQTPRGDGYACPATHPIAIPHITFNMWFHIKGEGTKNWRLASDNYPKTSGGYSGHADWVNGWDETVMSGIVKNCINAKKDCHSMLLGDGRTLF